MDFLRITVEAIVGFAALFAITKILGKTQITQITPFDFISALILGELIGNALYDPEVGLVMILYTVTLWGTLIWSIDIITQKFRRSRALLEGKPSLLIRRGQLQRKIMNENRIDLNQLMHLLREKGVFSIQEVEYAILESNGALSILKKHLYQTPNYQFFNATPKAVYLPTAVILDGEIVLENLKEIEIDENTLRKEVEKQGLTIEEVIYAEWHKEQGLYIMPS